MFVFVWCEKWARKPYDLYPVSNPDWYSDHSSGRTPWALAANMHTRTHTHIDSFTHPSSFSFVLFLRHTLEHTHTTWSKCWLGISGGKKNMCKWHMTVWQQTRFTNAKTCTHIYKHSPKNDMLRCTFLPPSLSLSLLHTKTDMHTHIHVLKTTCGEASGGKGTWRRGASQYKEM